MTRKRKVPEVLWRLFSHQATDLAAAIVSLISPQRHPCLACRCRLRPCLRCCEHPASFLIRPGDPADYRKLLYRSYVVVAENAPSLDFCPDHRWSQREILERVIEMMLCDGTAASNVICSGYDKHKHSSMIVDLLTSSAWALLLERVGDDLMVYLLKYTSIFLPLTRKNHQQVAGLPITLEMKRKKVDYTQSVSERQQHSFLDGSNCISKPDTCVPHSVPNKLRPLRSNFVSICGQMSSCGVSSATGCKVAVTTGVAGSDTDGGEDNKMRQSPKQSIFGKRSRHFSWQCQKKQRLKLQECSDLTTLSTAIAADGGSLFGRVQCNSNNEVPARSSPDFKVFHLVCQGDLVNRQSMFYDSDCYSSVLPRKHRLNTVKPNFEGSRLLMENIFGLSCTNTNALSMPCSKSNSCIISPIGSSCPYHSLAKMLKMLIRRSRSCQHLKLLEKHCVVSCLDQKANASKSCVFEMDESKVHSDSGIGTKKHKKAVEAEDIELQSPRSYCTMSQVESFLWAVCRNIVPQDLLGTSYNWRILRKNISRIIRMRRFEKFSIKQCMHKLKISEFPFLSKVSTFVDHQVTENGNGQKINLNKEFNRLKNGADTKHKLLMNWIFWFFSCLVVPLVKANFYVTETEYGRHKLYYYRKAVWKKLKESMIAQFKDQSYHQLNEAAVKRIIDSRAFGFSKLRLLPKEKGMRILANLRAPSKIPAYYSLSKCHSRMQKYTQHLKSVNSVLHDTHAVLKGLQLKEPEKLGSSVFDYNDIYRKLCPFVANLKKGSMELPALFIVVCDVSRAFDSIDQNKLLGVMKEVIRKDEYHLQQSHQVVCIKQCLRVHENLVLIDQDIKPGFTGFTSPILFHSSHGIVTNQVQNDNDDDDDMKINKIPLPQRLRSKLQKYSKQRKSTKFGVTAHRYQYCSRHVTKEKLFDLLNDHIKGNVMKLDRNYYLQGRGIPQGSVLSSLLCSLYYGHLERNVIIPFIERTGGACTEKLFTGHNCFDASDSQYLKEDAVVSQPAYLLLRFIDDFIFVSTSKEQAASFFARFNRGFYDYNCFMNGEKFSLNFDVGNQSKPKSNRVHVAEDGTLFLCWSGLLINSRTLEVLADYTRYHRMALRSTLTICWQRKLGYHLKRKLCDFMRPKCNPIFYDSNINSAAVVRLNIYQAFLLSAMKFHCYVSEISYICKYRPVLYLKMIEKSLRYMRMLIWHRMRSISRGCSFRPILELQKGEVEWLGLKAYIEVLNRKQSRYKALLGMLRTKYSAHILTGSESYDMRYAVDRSNNSIMWKIKY